EPLMRQWMGIGLSTITNDMTFDFAEASEDPSQQPFFMARYGHRGPGELDLSNPRWIELGSGAFRKASRAPVRQRHDGDVEAEIAKLSLFKAPVIFQEWKLSKEMLELREQW